jgi:TetR/AcrR family transcriptional repressor of mexJK operon
MLEPRRSEVRARIVRAAIALFSRQGFHGTRTREIARLADVSEVTVFRYFDHKDDIFWAALQSCFSSIKPRLNLLGAASRDESPEVMLPVIVCLLVDIVTYSPELMRLVAVALLELRGPAEEICRENLTPLFTAISEYLARNIESGRVRKLNPAIVTAALALTVIMQPELSKIVDGSPLSQLGRREAINQYSEFWVNVLVPLHAENFSCFSSPKVAEHLLSPAQPFGRESQ